MSDVSSEVQHALTMLLESYARLLDEDRLEEWTELFVEESSYTIVSRENYDRKLPLSLMLCENKDMIRDRVMSLRQANIFNFHSNCHVLSLPRATLLGPGRYGLRCTYALYQSDQTGHSRLFSVGRYEDEVVERDGALLFAKKLVVVDTAAIPTLLAVPI